MIKLYYMRLEGDCSDEQSLALYEMLPERRKEAVDRARNPEIAKKRLYTGAFLQYVLAKETGIFTERLQYEYNEWGKPALVGSDIHFNLSHSGDYVVLAVSDQPIGIDVEHKTKNYEALAKRCFCPEEYEDIMSVDTREEQEIRFLEYWTMKEAYIKLRGEGMRIPFRSFLIERQAEALSKISGQEIFEKTIFLDAYCISVCSEKKEALKAIVVSGAEDTTYSVSLSDCVRYCKNCKKLY